MLFRSKVDQAVFYMRKGEDLIVIIVHVDDLTIVTSSVALMDHVKEQLKKDFKFFWIWGSYIGFLASKSRGVG